MADMTERETTKNELYSAIDRLRAQNERLRTALTSLKRSHDTCEDSWYSCPKSPDGCADESQTGCTCGADHYNAIIDAALQESAP